MSSLHPLLLVRVVVVAVGASLLIFAVATPGWSVAPYVEIGVFKYCSTITGVQLCVSELPGVVFEDDAFDAVKAMTVIGLLCAIGGLLLFVLILVLSLMGKDQISVLPIAAVGLAGGAFLFTIIGVIIWGARINKDKLRGADLGYSFALAIVGAFVQMAGGSLGFFGAYRMRQRS